MEVYTYAKKLSGKTESIYIPTNSIDEYEGDIDVVLGFTKPDKPIINPMSADGYRQPSSYDCKAISRIGNRDAGFITFSLEGGGLYGGNREFKFSGDSATEVASNLENIPKIPNVNALRSKILNNVRAEVLDVAMVLAEMQGTTNTIVNGLARIGRSLNAVKKGNPRHYAYLLSGRTKDNRRPTDKFLRESSGVYLEWKYGIMPTINDVAGACKAMDMNEDGSLWDNPPLLVGRASEIINSKYTTKVGFSTKDGQGGDKRSITLSARAEYKARIDYSVRGEGLRGLNRYGIGLSSIPTVLFDRTPFSFVLNMAFPISELIKAWTALQGCEVRGYSETLHKRITFPRDTFQLTLKPFGIPCTATLLKQPDWVSWRRNAFSTVPMPLPYVRNPIKTGNLATVLALFTQLRKPS